MRLLLPIIGAGLFVASSPANSTVIDVTRAFWDAEASVGWGYHYHGVPQPQEPGTYTTAKKSTSLLGDSLTASDEIFLHSNVYSAVVRVEMWNDPVGESFQVAMLSNHDGDMYPDIQDIPGVVGYIVHSLTLTFAVSKGDATLRYSTQGSFVYGYLHDLTSSQLFDLGSDESVTLLSGHHYKLVAGTTSNREEGNENNFGIEGAWVRVPEPDTLPVLGLSLLAALLFKLTGRQPSRD